MTKGEDKFTELLPELLSHNVVPRPPFAKLILSSQRMPALSNFTPGTDARNHVPSSHLETPFVPGDRQGWMSLVPGVPHFTVGPSEKIQRFRSAGVSGAESPTPYLAWRCAGRSREGLPDSSR